MRDISSISVDCADLHIQAFANYKPKEISYWLDNACPSIKAVIANRMEIIVKSTAPYENIAVTVQQYTPASLRDYFSPERPDRNFLFLQLMAYCAGWYPNVSCHQLVFSEDKLIPLSGPYAAFVNRICQLSMENREHILKLLEKDAPYIDNPAYILKERLTHLGCACGLAASSFVTPFISSSRHRTTLVNFIAKETRPRIKAASGKDFAGSIAALWLIIMTAITHDISIDFLIQQDFSKLAVIDGHELDEYQKKYLSAFLLASPAARNEALQQMLRWDLQL